MSQGASTSSQDQAKHWLKRAAAKSGHAGVAASVLVAADAGLGVIFAAVLVSAVTTAFTDFAAAAPWLAGLAVAAGARAAIAPAAAWFGAQAAHRVKRAARAEITAHLLVRPKEELGARVQAVTDDIEALDGYVARYEPARGATVFGPILVLLAALWASPVSAGIMAATLAPLIVALVLAGGAAAQEARRQFLALERLSGFFMERLQALPVILAFQAEGATTTRMAAAADELQERTMRLLRAAFVSSAALEFFAALSVALVAVYTGFSVLGLLPFRVPETLNLWEAFFVLALAPEFYAPLRRLAGAYHDKQIGEAAAERLAALGDAPVVAAPFKRLEAPPTIILHGVEVVYPDRQLHFSFAAPAGKITALVGPTGCGKSTVLALLIGLAQHSAGEITIDAEPLGATQDVAAQVSWAGQETLLFPGSFADNLRLANPDACDEALFEAIRSVGLEALVAQRGGLSSVFDERGSGLSGGERRRIALARALLKPAPILLLDEPTADLDSDNEAMVIAAIREAARARTTLIATHSQALIAAADHVVRLA
jgi:ATP-binding cassette subfamily C protein CydD